MASVVRKTKRPDKYTLYSITCLTNNKVYIGVCLYYIQRRHKHLYELRNCKHANSYLQEDFNIHGESAFVFDIIGEYHSQYEALRVEKYYTNYVFCLNKDICYNIISGGQDVASQIRNLYKIKLQNDPDALSKLKERFSKLHKGRAISDETKEKLRVSHIGKKASEETKAKLKKQRAGSGNSRAKKVVDISSGKVYGCLKDATTDLGLNYDTTRHRVNGRYKQKTNLKWL